MKRYSLLNGHTICEAGKEKRAMLIVKFSTYDADDSNVRETTIEMPMASTVIELARVLEKAARQLRSKRIT